MDPSQTHAQLVAMMQQAGLPMTTDNLNRAMEALARGEQLQSAPQTNGVEASIQRAMQPRSVTQQTLPTPPIPASAQPAAIATQQGVNDASGGVPLTAAYNWAPPENAGAPIDAILRDGIPIPHTTIPSNAQGPTWQEASFMLREQPTQPVVRDADAVQMPTQRAGLSPKRANNAPQSAQTIKDYLRTNKYANQPSAPFTRKTKREATEPR